MFGCHGIPDLRRSLHYRSACFIQHDVQLVLSYKNISSLQTQIYIPIAALQSPGADTFKPLRRKCAVDIMLISEYVYSVRVFVITVTTGRGRLVMVCDNSTALGRIIKDMGEVGCSTTNIDPCFSQGV